VWKEVFPTGSRSEAKSDKVAQSVFLPPMDWVLERTEHKGFLGITLGDEVFTHLDFADDVALLAHMLEILTCWKFSFLLMMS